MRFTPSRLLIVSLALSLAAGVARADDAKPRPAQVTIVSPFAVCPGQTAHVLLIGMKLDAATEVTVDAGELAGGEVHPLHASITSKGHIDVPRGMEADKVGDTVVEIDLPVPADCTAAGLTLSVATPAGQTPDVGLLVVPADQIVEEKEPNNGFREAQPIDLGKWMRGTIGPADDVDVYRFTAGAGETFSARVLARAHRSLLDSLLTVYDAGGHVVASSDDDGLLVDSSLTFRLDAAGTYFLAVTDANSRGGKQFPYLLKLDRAGK